jgi:3-hydroxyacyl-[acyl-carrier-protein] dehydratase
LIDLRSFRPLLLGAEAVRRLLPHRPPILLVDGVSAISTEPAALRSSKLVSASEPVFAGHFPDRPIWPGVYTIEGLAQSCALLGALLGVRQALSVAQPPLEIDAIAAFDRWPPGRVEETEPLRNALQSRAVLAALVAANVKLTRPVFAGQKIDYLVARTHTIGEMHRFEVEATVENEMAAHGTLTTAVLEAK